MEPTTQPAVEPEVTVEGLSTSLDDLIKAADATDVLGKGDANRVEHSGRVDEDGKGGGGRADRADAGGLDNMMVGKLAEAGIPADVIATLGDVMSGKQKPAKADENNDEDDMEGYMGKAKDHAAAYMKQHGSMKGYMGMPHEAKKSDDGSGGEPMVKSMDQFRKDPDIADAVDVSPYLEAMTARTADQIDNIRTELVKSFGNQTEVNQAQARALHQMGSLIKGQVGVIDELAKRLGIVERTPNPSKGATTTAEADVLSKGMPGEAGAGGGEALSKSETLCVLSYMNLEKGIKHIGAQPTFEAIGMLEGGAQVSPDVLKAAQQFLVQNPTEAEVARTYR